MSKKLQGNIMLLITALIWGSAFVAQRAGMEHIGPFTFNGIRSIIGGLVLIPVIFLFSKKQQSKKAVAVTKAPAPAGQSEEEPAGQQAGQQARQSEEEPARQQIEQKADQQAEQKAERKLLIIGGFCCGVVLFGASSLQQMGLAYTTAGKGGFITALYIVLVPILGIAIGKRVRPLLWFCVLIALIGLYLLCIKDGFHISKGDFLVLMCALVFSVHILVIDYFSPKVNGVKMSCIQFFVCGLISIPCMFLFETIDIQNILNCWLPICYAGVLSCGVAYTLQILGQRNTEPTVASLIMSLESVFAVLAGWLLLGEQLSLRELIGCIIMFAAIILSQLPGKTERLAAKDQ